MRNHRVPTKRWDLGCLNAGFAMEIYSFQDSALVIKYQNGETTLQAHHQFPAVVTRMTVSSNVGPWFHCIEHALYRIIELRMHVKIFSETWVLARHFRERG